MLKTIRIIIAIASIVMVTLLFVDFTGTAAGMWPFMAKIQFMPAVLSANIIALVIILGATLVFGRIYCSVICPLGIFQDVVNWISCRSGSRSRRVRHLHYEKPRTKTRLALLTTFVLLVIIGLTHLLAASIAGLIEPYSAYGRIATSIFAPAYDETNNALASWSEMQPDNYTFYRVASYVSIPVLVIAIVTLVVVVTFAWRGGRDYCNTVCPVGTILGYLSKYSLLKPVINTSKCINCGKCGRACKAKCIDTKRHDIDYSRCVACMDCINTCSEGAISYTVRRKAGNAVATAEEHRPDAGRRSFMAITGFVAGALATDAIAKTTDGGLTALKDKKAPVRESYLVPAGGVSKKHMLQHCTACQLCVQSCPNHVLRPKTSIEGFMQPELVFNEGYCDPMCVKCSEICPAGAIHPVTKEEKTSIKIGTARVNLETCISAADGENCGNCSRHCPAGAISMVPVDEDNPRGKRMPVVNEEVCIGCGACEYYCPVGTVADMDADTSAIHVEGIDVHREI